MKSAASKAGASTVPPPAKMGDRRLRTMPPTWNSGIMLKHTSVALRPQDAITHTAPTASVSRVYATVFFLPLHANAGSAQCCWLVLSALQHTLTCCEVKSDSTRPDGGHSISKTVIHALSQHHTSKHRPAQVQPGFWGICNLRWSFPHWSIGPLEGSHLVPEVCSNNTLSSRS